MQTRSLLDISALHREGERTGHRPEVRHPGPESWYRWQDHTRCPEGTGEVGRCGHWPQRQNTSTPRGLWVHHWNQDIPQPYSPNWDLSWPLLCWLESCPLCWGPRALLRPPVRQSHVISKVQILGQRKYERPAQANAHPAPCTPQEVPVIMATRKETVSENEPPVYT